MIHKAQRPTSAVGFATRLSNSQLQTTTKNLSYLTMGLFSKKNKKEVGSCFVPSPGHAFSEAGQWQDQDETSHYSPLFSESYNDSAGYNNQPGYASHQGPPPGTYNTGNKYNSGPAGGVSLVSSLSISF